MRQEENASGIACEETELDQALKEIIDKEKLAYEKGSEAKKKEKEIILRHISSKTEHNVTKHLYLCSATHNTPLKWPTLSEEFKI